MFIRLCLLGILLFGLLPTQSLAQLNLSTHNTALPVEIESDHLELLRKDQTAHFIDNVKAVQGNLSLFADDIMVFYHNKDSDSPLPYTPISRIDATGHVLLKTLMEEVTASKAIYKVDEHNITLYDNVVIKQGGTFVKGSKLTYDLKSGYSILDNSPDQTHSVNTDQKQPSEQDGRVRGVFVPK